MISQKIKEKANKKIGLIYSRTEKQKSRKNTYFIEKAEKISIGDKKARIGR